MTTIRSRDNPRVKRWAKLVTDSRFRKSEARVLIEGPHLVAEALQAGLKPHTLIVSESGQARPEIRNLLEKGESDAVIVADRIFGIVADADTPPGIAAEIEFPALRADGAKPVVFLEGIQDPSNVGAILRSAAAFGAGEVVLDRACADPWAPKALRAAMGGHFKLAVRQVGELEEAIAAFSGKLVCTVPTAGAAIGKAQLDGRLGWIFGAEGKGVSEALARRAAVKVTITMAPGNESLNVAAAAAICLHETFVRGER
jgi:TrmH family RNA methyltransferase